MNIVIIEDEILTAEELSDMIGQYDKSVNVSRILYSVKESLSYFQDQPSADLIFSDIQLGDGLSFEIFQVIRIETPIVFCTAYDEYALEAIRTNGIDYILKPFSTETVYKAINKYQSLKKHFMPLDLDYKKIIRSITGSYKAEEPVSSILVYQKDKIRPVGLDEIALFYIDGELTRLHGFNGKNYIVDKSLDDLEQIVQEKFFRVNRQHLVHRRAVVDANHYHPRKYVVNLSIPFKEVLVVSKNRTTAFLNWLTGNN
jgi:DNA-binding LytR/AlgR family response regulator